MIKTDHDCGEREREKEILYVTMFAYKCTKQAHILSRLGTLFAFSIKHHEYHIIIPNYILFHKLHEIITVMI